MGEIRNEEGKVYDSEEMISNIKELKKEVPKMKEDGLDMEDILDEDSRFGPIRIITRAEGIRDKVIELLKEEDQKI